MDHYNERIDKIIASTGLMSRKDAKKAAKERRILLNGEPIKDCSAKSNENDILTLDGKIIKYEKYIYVMLNKPKGYVCSTDDPSSPIINSLLSPELQKLNLFSIGRLDKNTTGLVVLTNDGILAHNLISPNKHVDKKYYVETKVAIKNSDIEYFKLGATLEDGYKCLPADLHPTGTNKAQIIIREGKYHQIKRMFESIGNKVLDLSRISIGGLSLDIGLKPGEFRILTPEEITLLRNCNNP